MRPTTIPDTYWHSNWNPPEPALPHSLILELKQPLTARGFIYTPRKDCDHGRIARYRIHASSDGKSWNPITEGAWENTDRPQTVRLETPDHRPLLQTGSPPGSPEPQLDLGRGVRCDCAVTPESQIGIHSQIDVLGEADVSMCRESHGTDDHKR